ncbi:energy transducer TonB [Oceanicaulis sp.]|uniref:energy transducer TonB n=1 Tax=Oceanicaulis sp. TaxID=1924941 RepID=UPI003D26E940
MRFFSVLIVWLSVTAMAIGQDDSLPESVTTPYLAYEAAVEAGDEPAAAEAAEQAWRAALEASVDPAVLTILAENAGFASFRTADFETAEDAFLNAVEMNQQSAGDPLLRARSLRYVSDVQLRQGKSRQSFISAEAALEILEPLTPSEAVHMEIALSNAFMSSSRWARGQYRSAGRHGERAVRAARSAGIVQAPVFGVAAFQAGAYYSDDDQPMEAAYWFAVANSLLSQAGTGRDLLAATRAWGSMEREELDSEDRIALLDRLRADNVYQPGYEEALQEAFSERGEGWVDAVARDRRAPQYPTDAARVGAEGFALMRFDVNADGRTENVEVVYSIPYREFGEAGERAVREWRYQPATRDGVPVARPGIVTNLQFEMAD